MFYDMLRKMRLENKITDEKERDLGKTFRGVLKELAAEKA